MDSDSEEIESKTVLLERDYDIEDYVSDCQRLFIQKSFACDLELLCSDGSLPFYQCLLASHSEYMNQAII